MKLVYANILWFGLLITGLVYDVLSKVAAEEWGFMGDILLKYAIFWGLVSLLLISSIIGLLLRRKWGYELALASNSSMALLPVALFAASLVFIPSLSMFEQLEIHAANLLASGVSLIFWAAQVFSGLKYRYEH